MRDLPLLSTSTATNLAMEEVPALTPAALRQHLLDAVTAGDRLVSLFGTPTDDDGTPCLAVLASDRDATLTVGRAVITGAWPAMAQTCDQAQLFERELAEQAGVNVTDHPHLTPVRHEIAWGAPRPAAASRTPGVAAYHRIEGDEVHEVAVGPVHAGVIDPAHFRFQCHGERMLSVEMGHGYQHRGVEAALIGGPDRKTVPLFGTLCGDTTVGHTIAGCEALEALGSVIVPPRGQALRALALELERLANHVGDLGALSGDIGYQRTAASCGRLRGGFLNATAVLNGSRLGRGFIRPGGVRHDVTADHVAAIAHLMHDLSPQVADAARAFLDSAGVRGRLEGVGVLTTKDARALGVVGVPARASGLRLDARRDRPTGAYLTLDVPAATTTDGDAYSRALVRWHEIQASVHLVHHLLTTLPDGPTRANADAPLRPNAITTTCVEGWRGELWHTAITGPDGTLARYKVVDPSFHNWPGLMRALRDEAISDFPLCNKSSSLSYESHVDDPVPGGTATASRGVSRATPPRRRRLPTRLRRLRRGVPHRRRRRPPRNAPA